MGRDASAWPMLALFVVVVLAAIGCVLWFMREAMRNERLAVRQRLAEAYQGHLALAQAPLVTQWKAWLSRFDMRGAGASEHFARCVRDLGADSVICFGEDDAVLYPRRGPSSAASPTPEADSLQGGLRALIKTADADAVTRFVFERFAEPDAAVLMDAQGRLLAANAELSAIELLHGSADARLEHLTARLRKRLTDYANPSLSSAQRLFVMRELQRLAPGTHFPTLAAEELAARFVETQPAMPEKRTLHPAPMPDLWAVPSPDGRVLVLLRTATAAKTLTEAARGVSWPAGVTLTVLSPGQESTNAATIATAALGPDFPGWKLVLSLADRAAFENAADQRVARYLSVGSVVIAAMIVLALIVARGFGRQMQLTRLKNDLVANVSHELKTPLTAMRALVDTLLDRERFDPETTREYLQMLSRENARLSRLIENFLTFSRLERNKFAFDFAPLRPEAVVESARTAFGERAHAPGCTFESHVAPNLPAIRGDSDALVTALLNLLDNACKYSAQEKHVALTAAARNGSVRFAVQDNGIGLSASERAHVFDRFYQSDRRLSRSGSGCGLGLTIVRSIVEAHHGSVEVESEPGRGSTFTIEIPVAGETVS